MNYKYFNCSKSENLNFIKCDNIIGNANKDAGIFPYFVLIISIAGLILNVILIRDFIVKSNESSRRQSSMKKLFTVLPILDSITSIYWIISSTVFKKVQKIWEKKDFCAVLSIIHFSVHTFEFIFINFILIHFRKISLNPIEGILKPSKNIKKYILVSVILTLLIMGHSIAFKIFGRSPMNTCFINTEQSGMDAIIFIISILSTLSVIAQIIYDLSCRQMFVNDRQVRETYKNNSLYILVFSLLHIPMFILIMVTIQTDSFIHEKRDFLSHFSTFTTIISCSIPMIVGIIRNCKGFTKIRKVKEIQRKVTSTLYKKQTIAQINKVFSKPLSATLTSEDQFEWLEKHAMEFFMRDILISVAHCINAGKSFGKIINLNDLEKENEASITHNITFDSFRLNDSTVTEADYLDVTVIEYAPKIFAYLRNLENLDIDEMAGSFLPKNNKQGISESQGKSGSFFISTDDNQFMIKTLRVDEFDLIRKTFLNEYVNYIVKNTSSLLCRIYGMYNVIMQGEDILIIVMRNVIGEFKDNIIAKYDLKGSSYKRIADFDMDKSDSGTMKDLNFNNFEHGIMLSRENIKRFRKMTKFDSYFLSRMQLMDYSLFLVKITLSKEEAVDLFGREIKKKQEEAFNDLIEGGTIRASIIGDPRTGFNYDNLMAEIKPRKISNSGGKIFRYTKYYKHYLYPSLIPGCAYILAIIDYFQIFNFFKYVESGLKTQFGAKKDQISCVDPQTYSKRFITYFIKLTDIKEMLKEGQKCDTIISNSNEESDESENGKLTDDSKVKTQESSDIELEIMKK